MRCLEGRGTECCGIARCRVSCALVHSSKAKCTSSSTQSCPPTDADLLLCRRDIDISANGQHALVSQADGCAALVRIEDDNRGQVERLFTIKDTSLGATFGPNARLAPGLILWGAAQGFILVWDFQQPQIIRAMDVGDGAEPVALALCRTPRSGIASALVVGTADGRLTWWAPPEDGELPHAR